MFDYRTYEIENDSDILAMESEISMIDFAMESAQCEIAFGNEEYQSVVEAAFAKKKEANKGLLRTIIDKAQKLLSSLISAVTDAMNRIRMFITGKQIKSAEKKLSKAQKVGIGVAGGVVVVGGLLAAFAHGKRLGLKEDYKKLYEKLNNLNDDDSKLSEKDLNKAVKERLKEEKIGIKDLPKAGNYLMADLKEMGQILKHAANLPGEHARKIGGWISSKFKELKEGAGQLTHVADKTGGKGKASEKTPAEGASAPNDSSWDNLPDDSGDGTEG